MAEIELPGPRARVTRPEGPKGGSASPLADSFRSGFWGQLGGAVEREAAAWQQADPNFDYTKHIPQGYEAYHSAFQGASSQHEVDVIKSSIDDNVALRQRREQRSFGKNLWTDLLVGVADPVNLVGLGGAAGVGIAKGALAGAKSIGLAGAAEEVARGSLDPTAGGAETAVSAASAFGLGAVIGGVAGRFGHTVAPRYGAPRLDNSIVEGLVARGIPRTAARGSAAGVFAEAANRHDAVNPTSGAKGLGQWLGSRKKALEQRYGANPTKEQQLDFLADELKGGDAGGKHVLAAGSEEEAAAAYITKFMRPAKGKETTGDLERASQALGKQVAPSETIDRLEGLQLPEHIDGIPVVEANHETGPLAVYVPGKSGDQVLGEVAMEESRARVSHDRLGGEVDADPLAGIEHAKLSDIPSIVASEHRKANTLPGYAEQLGLSPVGGRVDLEDVRKLVEQARKDRLIAEMQRKQDAGDINWQRGDRLAEVEGPLDRDRLTMRVRMLRERVAKLQGQARSTVAAQIKRIEDELAAAGGESTPDVQVGGTEFGSQLAAEGDLYVQQRARESAKPDEELAALRAEDRAKYLRDLDSGEIPDALPFGLDEGIAPGGLDGAHFVINRRRILDLFASKPWTESRDGVVAFEADAFETPAEWLDFVIAHEREHSLNPRSADESEAAYENRVNDEAYKAVVAKRADLSIERSWTLIGTPLHRAYSLVKDSGARFHHALYKLASDMSVQTAAGKAGRSLTPDGSVFQRVDRWRAKSAEIGAALRREYMEEMGLGDGGRVLNEVRSGVIGLTNKLGGRKTFDQFKQEVVAHHIGFTETWNGVDYANPSEAVKRAAAVLAKVDAQVEREATDLDIFKQGAKDKLELAERLDKQGLTGEAEQLRAEASRPMNKLGGQHYYRMYDQSALLADPEGARARLKAAYQRLGLDEASAEGQALSAYEHLTLDPDGATGMRRMAHGAKKVEIPWTDAEAFPYIVRDPEASYGIYLKQMGGQIEMTRTFGDAHALDEIDAMRQDLIDRGVEPAKAEEAILLFEDARDHILGQFHRMNALAWDYRAARVLKGFAQMAVLGKGIYSQVNDLAKFIGVQGLGVKRLMTGEGPAGLIGGLAAAVKGDLDRFSPGGIAKQAGEALELSNSRVVALMMDSDAAVYAQRDTRFERLLARMSVPYFMINLMTPWTVALKEMAGTVAAHNLIDDAKKVAAAIQAGEEPATELLERLGQSNFTRQDAQLLAAMPTEKGTTGLHLANVMAWEGKDGAAMRSKLLAAVNGEIKRSVISGGVLDRPRIMDGVFYSKEGRNAALEDVALKEQAVQDARASLKGLDPLSNEYAIAIDELKEATAAYNQARAGVGQQSRNYQPLASLPFQLHSFALASGSKLLHGLFSSSERNRVGGMLSLMLTGMYITWLKHFDPVGAISGNAERKKKKQDQWDKMTWGAYIAHSFEYSNLGAIFTDVVKNADTAAAEATGGVVPGWGAPDDPNNPYQREHPASETVGATLGVAPGLITGLVTPFINGDPASAKVAAIKRVVPYANMLWWNGAVDRLQSLAAGDAARGPAPPGFGGGGGVGSGNDAAPSLPSFLGANPGVPDARAPLLDVIPASSVTVPDLKLDPNAPLPLKPVKKKARARRVIPLV